MPFTLTRCSDQRSCDFAGAPGARTRGPARVKGPGRWARVATFERSAIRPDLVSTSGNVVSVGDVLMANLVSFLCALVPAVVLSVLGAPLPIVVLVMVVCGVTGLALANSART